MESRAVVSSMAHNLLYLLLILCLGSSPAWAGKTASNTGQKNSNSSVTLDALQAKIDSLNARQDLDAALKTRVLKLYQSAQDNLANTEGFNSQTAGYKEAVSKAPDQTKKLQRDIDQLQQRLSRQKIEDFSNIPIAELEQRLILEKGKISSLDEQIKKLENELVLQNSRPQLIREEIVKAKQELESAQRNLEMPAGNSVSKLETETGQLQLKTLIESRTAELKMLDIEAISNPSRVEQLKAELQLLGMQKAALTPVVAAIENLVNEKRQQEAREVQEALSQAEKAISGKHPVIQAFTRENIQYSRDLQFITGKIERYGEQKARVDEQAAEIGNDFKSAEKKISLAGLSPALGKILREQRRNLPTVDQFALQSQTIQNETALISLEQFKIDDKLKKLADLDDELQAIMSQQVDAALPAGQRMMIQAELRVLLDSQKDLLNKLSVAYTTYLRTLGDLDFARQQMVKQADDFAVYLDERLLWVPSSAPINKDFIVGLYHSVQWLLSPFNWLAALKDTGHIAFENLFLAVIAVFGLIASVLARNWAKQQLAAVSEKVEKIYTDNFNYTLRALGYTLILVLPLPLFFHYLGWFLNTHAHLADFSKSVGAGLLGVSAPLFFLEFFYRLFASKGIASKHFQWQKSTVSFLRGQIAWMRFVVLPAVFIIYATEASQTSSHGDSLGRLALIIVMMVLAVFLGRALHPSKGLIKDDVKARPDKWLFRLRYVWYSAIILVPVIVIGFAVAGYYQSAVELQQKLTVTLRLLFVSVIVHQMVVRWLTLVNRQLALKNVRQKRKIAASSAKQAAAGAEDPALPVDEELIDIPKINAQTTKLLNVFIGFGIVIGFWMIWRNILPAFSFLDNIVLWQHKAIVEGQESYQPITMTNMMLAGLYAFIVVVSVRNFSGVVELLIFRRLSIEAGSRYAINQLAKYVLIGIGFLGVANELGGSWSQVQWLVAALGVGLGFGLQEIFANLVSGIILLFERPVRVGDTVTIGDVSGKVSRIQMRATTIIDWDQKELIVPNKTFITNQLVNWTLSDATTRVVIPVSIAYGSDVALAHKVMMDTVRSIPLVLADPEPSVLFVGFGESSLDFSIRIFVSELSDRMPVTHDLHVRLEKAFREHNIEIPFPQRDLHLRSIVQKAKVVDHLKDEPGWLSVAEPDALREG
ncbi:mechanosensitive ion channel domain-containing protein [Methylobacter sp. YRD-M1]|uniref:mechanosensitive ion channel domain-containing protein n=1 Tax=Methylobacter sp. YRD-M1 TaxID=2911520 RepID=UPI002DD67995|nr:mechanosensitive ion channel domain-containing protein [Methylobacter sp. YRD-M1]